MLFLLDAADFLNELEEKSRTKILYTIWKARLNNDNTLFKKLQDDIWEFRTHYNKTYYRLFAFWDKSDKLNAVVVVSHGIIKKSDKVHLSDLAKAKSAQKQYFNEKNDNQ